MTQRKQRETEPEKDADALEEAARVLRHPLRVQILVACHQREMTPKDFAQPREISIPVASYHFRALEKAGYIQVVRQESVRGARRYFYRAKRPGLITTEEFAQAGPEAQRAASVAVVRSFFARCVEAIGKGTFDARPDSHFAWSPMEVDKQGWDELMTALDGIFKLSCEIMAEAQDRLHTSGETPIPVTLGLAGFESPAEDAINPKVD